MLGIFGSIKDFVPVGKKVDFRNKYSGFTKKCNDLRIYYRGGGRFWSYFQGKNRPIYMA